MSTKATIENLLESAKTAVPMSEDDAKAILDEIKQSSAKKAAIEAKKAEAAAKVEQVEGERIARLPSITPVMVSPEPVIEQKAPDILTAEAALYAWSQTKEGAVNLGGPFNPDRVAAVIRARVSAAFVAGFSAGVGEKG
jgi:hypothetical protein